MNAIVFCDGCNLAVHQGTCDFVCTSHLLLMVPIFYRLLWCTIYTRRSMALPEMYRITGTCCRKS
jgi:hypothetical protein